MKIPSKAECEKLWYEFDVPENVREHCAKVCEVAIEVADKVVATRKVNRDLVIAAAMLHDIGRGKAGKHEIVAYELLMKKGLTEVAEIVACHPLHYLLVPGKGPKTIEQKIVFYADKRVVDDKIVGLVERLNQLIEKYPAFSESTKKAMPLAIKLEKELMT